MYCNSRKRVKGDGKENKESKVTVRSLAVGRRSENGANSEGQGVRRGGFGGRQRAPIWKWRVCGPIQVKLNGELICCVDVMGRAGVCS